MATKQRFSVIPSGKYFGHSYEQKFFFSLAWDLQRMAYGHLENSDLSLSGCDYSKHHTLPWSDSPACLLSSLSSAAASSSVLTGCVFPSALEYSSVSLESTSTSGGKSRISPNIKTWCQNSFCTIAASDGCQMGWWPCTPCCSQPLWREVVASWSWPVSAKYLTWAFWGGCSAGREMCVSWIRAQDCSCKWSTWIRSLTLSTAGPGSSSKWLGGVGT